MSCLNFIDTKTMHWTNAKTKGEKPNDNSNNNDD